VTKAATLLGVSRVTFSKFMSYDNNVSEEQWVKINVDRKRVSYNEKGCFEKSQNYCITGDGKIQRS
jgi:hypothetical protein